MKELLGPMSALLPTIALVGFVGLALLVAFYIATDGRRAHRRRMAAMALDEDVPAQGKSHD